MTNLPLVSVIIPSYKRAHLLEKAVKSVLEQTHSNLECIIVDDGSPDNTRQVSEDLMSRDSRVKYFYKENGGATSARNFGIKHARGEWIQFLDSDDWLHPEKIRFQLDYTRNLESDNVVAPVSKMLSVAKKKTQNSLRIGFMGRWHRTKGIHVLVEAVKAIPQKIDLQLTIHGVASDELYKQEVLLRIGDEQRIHVGKQLAREELYAALTNFDVLAVPSQWLETGPLVVLEAHALGLPVVGSNLGGIAELVKQDVDGLLVAPRDVRAWTKAFVRLATEPNLLNKLRQGIQPIRTIEMEAAETIALYKSLL